MFHQNREAELLQKVRDKDQTIASLREENNSLRETIITLERKLQAQVIFSCNGYWQDPWILCSLVCAPQQEENLRQQEKQRQLKEHEVRMEKTKQHYWKLELAFDLRGLTACL